MIFFIDAIESGTHKGIVLGFYKGFEEKVGYGILTDDAITLLEKTPLSHEKLKFYPKLMGTTEALIELGYLKSIKKWFIFTDSYVKIKYYNKPSVSQVFRKIKGARNDI